MGLSSSSFALLLGSCFGTCEVFTLTLVSVFLHFGVFRVVILRSADFDAAIRHSVAVDAGHELATFLLTS